MSSNNVTLASLKRAGHDNPEEVWRKICDIGGFGDLEPNIEGGLDIAGLSDSTRGRIEDLIASPKPPADDKTDKKTK